MNQAQMYVFHRLRGSGTIEAAELAGYCKGRPSEKARRLWEAACKIRHGFPPDALADYEKRIEQKAAEVEDMRRIHEAALVVDEIRSTRHMLIDSDEQDMA